MHSFAYFNSFISGNKYIRFILCVIIFVFVFVFANISPNSRICIHICQFLANPNIYVFVQKIRSTYIRICNKKNQPEHSRTLKLYSSHTDNKFTYYRCIPTKTLPKVHRPPGHCCLCLVSLEAECVHRAGLAS